jgi:hypothetical protein
MTCGVHVVLGNLLLEICCVMFVDGVYSYQNSYGFASGEIPSSGEPKVSNPWNKCVT